MNAATRIAELGGRVAGRWTGAGWSLVVPRLTAEEMDRLVGRVTFGRRNVRAVHCRYHGTALPPGLGRAVHFEGRSLGFFCLDCLRGLNP